MNKRMTWFKALIIALTCLPMLAVGVAGGYATYVNMENVLHRSATALGVVAAGEGATLIAALVALTVTLMGQHTPGVVRAALWLIPVGASVTGYLLAPNANERVVMTLTPLAMTAAGEGIAFVARRVVAYQTNVDIEQQRRGGLLLWHANYAAKGNGLTHKWSALRVAQLTKAFASTDAQLSVQLGEIQRYRIAEGADANLATVLGWATNDAVRPAVAPAVPAPALPPVTVQKAVSEPPSGSDDTDPDPAAKDDDAWIQDLLADHAERQAEAKLIVTLLTGDDVARQLNMKPGTIRSWVQRGKLRVHDKDENGRNLFHPDDVAALSTKMAQVNGAGEGQ